MRLGGIVTGDTGIVDEELDARRFLLAQLVVETLDIILFAEAIQYTISKFCGHSSKR